MLGHAENKRFHLLPGQVFWVLCLLCWCWSRLKDTAALLIQQAGKLFIFFFFTSSELRRCLNVQLLAQPKEIRRKRVLQKLCLLVKHQRRKKNLKSNLRVKFVQLTQKIKLKKNNIYLMHFVQPATAMLPGLISSSLTPQISLLSRVAQALPEDSVYSGEQGRERLYAANPSFIIKSENRDGELPTSCSGREEKKAEGTSKLPIPQERTGSPALFLCKFINVLWWHVGTSFIDTNNSPFNR